MYVNSRHDAATTYLLTISPTWQWRRRIRYISNVVVVSCTEKSYLRKCSTQITEFFLSWMNEITSILIDSEQKMTTKTTTAASSSATTAAKWSRMKRRKETKNKAIPHPNERKWDYIHSFIGHTSLYVSVAIYCVPTVRRHRWNESLQRLWPRWRWRTFISLTIIINHHQSINQSSESYQISQSNQQSTFIGLSVFRGTRA